MADHGVGIKFLRTLAPKDITVEFPAEVPLHAFPDGGVIGTAALAGDVYKYVFPAHIEEVLATHTAKIRPKYSEIDGGRVTLVSLHLSLV